MDFVTADCTVRSGLGRSYKIVKEEHNYKMCNATFRCFNGLKYIWNCAVKVIEDIGEIIDDIQVEDPPGAAQVVKGEIVAFIAMDK